MLLFSSVYTHGQSIRTGIDTTLPSGTGLNGADAPNGDRDEWEWDGDDGGGFNQGLLWFDIPQGLLDGFQPDSRATLKLRNSDSGDSGDVHRITSNWLDGPDGGNMVTYNNFPDGPGIVPGANAEETPSFMTGALTDGVDYEFDVTADVMAWVGGEPNYGWGFLPTGGGGNGIVSFEHATLPHPELVLSGLVLADGDFNDDGALDLADFNILAANFLTGTTFEQGDMNLSGLVNLEDFVSFRIAFNAQQAGIAVPEPSGFAVVYLAGIVMVAYLRRRSHCHTLS
jgi:hypothetical protein